MRLTLSWKLAWFFLALVFLCLLWVWSQNGRWSPHPYGRVIDTRMVPSTISLSAKYQSPSC